MNAPRCPHPARVTLAGKRLYASGHLPTKATQETKPNLMPDDVSGRGTQERLTCEPLPMVVVLSKEGNESEHDDGGG